MTLKRLAITTACAGGGFAVVLSLVIGGFMWFQARPKPWDEQGITASFDHIELLQTFDEFYVRTHGSVLPDEPDDSSDLGPVRINPEWTAEQNRVIANVRERVKEEARNSSILRFHYVLLNNTAADYRLETASSTMMVKRGASLTNDESLSGSYPLFIPAGQRVDFTITYNFYSGRGDQRKELADNPPRFMKTKLPHLDGFALFDETNKVQIDFPKGW